MSWIDEARLAPPVAAELRRLETELWHGGGLDPRILSLCEQRMEQLIGVRAEVDDAPATDRERLAVGFAEQYVLDAHGVTDEQCAALNEHFTPSELATLTTGLAMFESAARMRAALGGAS